MPNDRNPGAGIKPILEELRDLRIEMRDDPEPPHAHPGADRPEARRPRKRPPGRGERKERVIV
jgi:hypothetical protein